jgi:phospholipase/lecithinase/hemolysin
MASTADVTDRIVDGVKRLQQLGVNKVLVDTLPPLGCTPWQSLRNYSTCDSFGNNTATIHNTNLREKLAGSENVLLLDLYDTLLEKQFIRTSEIYFLYQLISVADTINKK